MTPRIDVTVAHPPWRSALADVEGLCRRAAVAALGHAKSDIAGGEVSVLLCDDETVTGLNATYRGMARPTNVLSFPNGPPCKGLETRLLGDVAIAFETVSTEAMSADRAIGDHLMHLVVHGVLHLLGYDHETTLDAEEMEALEAEILDQLGVADPYAEEIAPSA